MIIIRLHTCCYCDLHEDQATFCGNLRGKYFPRGSHTFYSHEVKYKVIFICAAERQVSCYRSELRLPFTVFFRNWEAEVRPSWTAMDRVINLWPSEWEGAPALITGLWRTSEPCKLPDPCWKSGPGPEANIVPLQREQGELRGETCQRPHWELDVRGDAVHRCWFCRHLEYSTGVGVFSHHCFSRSWSHKLFSKPSTTRL